MHLCFLSEDAVVEFGVSNFQVTERIGSVLTTVELSLPSDRVTHVLVSTDDMEATGKYHV